MARVVKRGGALILSSIFAMIIFSGCEIRRNTDTNITTNSMYSYSGDVTCTGNPAILDVEPFRAEAYTQTSNFFSPTLTSHTYNLTYTNTVNQLPLLIICNTRTNAHGDEVREFIGGYYPDNLISNQTINVAYFAINYTASANPDNVDISWTKLPFDTDIRYIIRSYSDTESLPIDALTTINTNATIKRGNRIKVLIRVFDIVDIPVNTLYF